MYIYDNPVRRDSKSYDEVDEFCRMCNDHTEISFDIENIDSSIYKTTFQVHASFESNVTEDRFKEFVKSCHSVIDRDTYDYISLESESCEFEKEFDFIKGEFRVQIDE